MTYQKRLIRHGTGDFHLNFDKRVLRADFWHGFLTTCPRENNKYKSTQLHLPYNQLMWLPLGSMLEPLLVLVYINDIAENLLSLVRLFADDSSLFFSATNLRDIEGVINHDLALTAAWAKKWLVDFNPIKIVAMLFSLRPVDYLPSLNFNNTSINFVKNHKL